MPRISPRLPPCQTRSGAHSSSISSGGPPGPAGVWSFMNAAPSGRQAELHQAVDQAAAEPEGAPGRGTHARGGGPVIRAAVQVNADDRGKAALPGVPEPEQGQRGEMRARGGAREQQPAGAETVTDARRGPARGCHAIVELTGDGRLGNQPVIRADDRHLALAGNLVVERLVILGGARGPAAAVDPHDYGPGRTGRGDYAQSQ